MRNRFSAKVLAIGLACALTAGMAHAENLTITGSGNLEFVLGELAKAFNGSQSKHRVSVPPSTGTAGGLRDLMDGTTTLGRIGRPLREKERAEGLTFFPLGRDPVAFAGGSGVTVTSISPAQLIDVYTGKAGDWRELGGRPGPIRAVGRERTDASAQAISAVLPAFKDITLHESVKVVHLDPQMIALLDRYPTSFGFLNRSALLAAKTKLALLSLDGAAPTAENVASGRYPIWLEFGLAYHKARLTDGGREFLRFIESPAGDRVLRASGILPPPSRS